MLHTLRKTLYLRYFIFIFLSCFTPELFAGIFDPPATDKSVHILGMIFGSNVGNIFLGGAPDILLNKMFEKFNIIIVSVGAIVISYIAIISTINTAQEGQVMGKKWSSIWIPLRSILGILLMVPTPASGYSLIQVTVLWLILQGIGAADRIWNIVLDNLEQGVSVSTNIDYSSESGNLSSDQSILVKSYLEPLSKQLLSSAVCAKAIKKIATGGATNKNGTKIVLDQEIASFADDINPYFTPVIKSADGYTYKTFFNIGKRSTDNYFNDPSAYICGSYTLTATVKPSDIDPNSKMTPEESANLAQDHANLAFEKKQEALSNMFQMLNAPAGKIINKDTSNIDDVMSIKLAVDYYSAAMTELMIPKPINQEKHSNEQIGRETGWISAGSYYFVITQEMNPGLLPTATKEPPTKVGNTIPECIKPNCATNYKIYFPVLTDLLDERAIKYVAHFEELTLDYLNTKASKSFSSTTDYTSLSLGSVGNELLGFLQQANANAMKAIRWVLQLNDGDPLRNMAKFGTILMITSELGWILATVAGIAIASTAIPPACYPLNTIVMVLMFYIIPVILAVCVLLWGFGASLSIYLPMIPYLIFTLTAIGWLFLVIEAIVAAPILSLAMVIPSSDELGKVTTGLGLLLGIILRPTLTIFGFILAAKTFQAVIKLVNFGMIDAMGSINVVGSMFSAIPTIGLYIGFILALANKCFGLIHILPDKVLRWIGIAPESTGDEGALNAAKGGAEAGSKFVSEGMSKIGNIGAGISEKKKEAAKEAREADTAKAAGERHNQMLDAISKIGAPSGGGGGSPGAGGGGSPAGGGGSPAGAGGSPPGAGGGGSPGAGGGMPGGAGGGVPPPIP